MLFNYRASLIKHLSRNTKKEKWSLLVTR